MLGDRLEVSAFFCSPNAQSSGRACGLKLFFASQTAVLVYLLDLDLQWICSMQHCHHNVKSPKSNAFHVPYLCISELCLNKQEQ